MSRPAVKRVYVKKKGAPAYLVSFGDMMTLILCFFILLVAMSKERNFGLMARGLGSFIITIRSFGLSGVLDEAEKRTVFDQMRRRFNLPPEDDPERTADDPDRAAQKELVRAEHVESLEPHDEVRQPRVATFATGSAALGVEVRRYLDALAPSLRPGRGHLLVLEGHATDAGPTHRDDDAWLAYDRARAVRDYLVERHGFPADRVEARAWLHEIRFEGVTTRAVDARLVVPTEGTNDERRRSSDG